MILPPSLFYCNTWTFALILTLPFLLTKTLYLISIQDAHCCTKPLITQTCSRAYTLCHQFLLKLISIFNNPTRSSQTKSFPILHALLANILVWIVFVFVSSIVKACRGCTNSFGNAAKLRKWWMVMTERWWQTWDNKYNYNIIIKLIISWSWNQTFWYLYLS